MARIIVIDDEADMRTLLRAILESQDHEIDEAENGALALKALGESHYDLIITDVLMPDEDGFVVVKETLKLQSDAKILAISGGGLNLGSNWSLEMIEQLGAHAVLKKPFEMHEFLNKVEGLLAQ